MEGVQSYDDAPSRSILNLAEEFMGVGIYSRGFSNNMIHSRMGWSPPRLGWIKLNIDGAVRRGDSLAAIGGVLRDTAGQWLGGFTQNLGCSSPDVAELWAVLRGLQLAWSARYRRVELEVDSSIVFGEISHRNSHSTTLLLHSIWLLLDRDWEVDLRWIPRASNVYADALARMGFTAPQELQFLDTIPHYIKSFYDSDLVNVVHVITSS